jgi:hypothetical protein
MERIGGVFRPDRLRSSEMPDVLVCLLAGTPALQTEMQRIGEIWRLGMPRVEFVVITELWEGDRLKSELAAILSERYLSTERLLLVAHGVDARRTLALIFSSRQRFCRGIMTYGACPLPSIPSSCSGRGIQLRLIEGNDGTPGDASLLAADVRTLQIRHFDVRAATLPGSVERWEPDAVRLGGAYLRDMVATSLASIF